jgi:hypothetical protein
MAANEGKGDGEVTCKKYRISIIFTRTYLFVQYCQAGMHCNDLIMTYIV